MINKENQSSTEMIVSKKLSASGAVDMEEKETMSNELDALIREAMSLISIMSDEALSLAISAFMKEGELFG